MHHHQDYTGFPVTPGGWIVRVSPPGQNLEDEFLHVLVAGGAEQTAAELLSGWRLLEAGGATALAGNGVVLVFPEESGQEKISFRVPEGDGKLTAYLLGLPHDAQYRVQMEGEKEGRELKAVKGVIAFELPGAGRAVVKRLNPGR
jgi:hypothetical protein